MSVKEDIYLAWAPADTIWSRWAKPILFSFMGGEPSPLPTLLSVEGGNLTCDGTTAMVIDLPGVESVKFALQAAGCGYRPVPLFNAYPHTPDSRPEPALTRSDIVTHLPVVDMSRTVAALQRGAALINKLQLSAQAPPAFMIDSLRHGVGIPIHVGMFDNRSAVDPSDFPSSALLVQHGVKRMLLVREQRTSDDDLNSVLLAWQNGGIPIDFLSARPGASPERITIAPPSLLRRLWHRFCMVFYSKDGYGAFGRAVSSSG